MTLRIEHPKLMIISFLIMYSLSGYQFYNRQNDFLKLKKEGIITATKTTFIPKKFTDYYKLEFTTKDNKNIIKTGKCVDYRTFIRDYSHLKVIYLLNKPDNFWELPNFENYSLVYTIFFFFVPYGLIGSFVLYGFFKFCNDLRFKKNRIELIKTLLNAGS